MSRTRIRQLQSTCQISFAEIQPHATKLRKLTVRLTTNNIFLQILFRTIAQDILHYPNQSQAIENMHTTTLNEPDMATLASLSLRIQLQNHSCSQKGECDCGCSLKKV